MKKEERGGGLGEWAAGDGWNKGGKRGETKQNQKLKEEGKSD